MLHLNADSISLTSVHHIDIVSSHFIKTKRRGSMGQLAIMRDTYRELAHIHITFIAVYCCNYPALLLAIVHLFVSNL